MRNVVILSICFIQLSEAGVLCVSLQIDKTVYCAVIKFFVKEGLTPNEIHSKFINVYGDSSSFSTINGLPSLNVAVPALKMIHVKDVQKVQQHHKSLNKCTIWYLTTGRLTFKRRSADRYI
jgi:L-ribulose-5-phosphate 3-epimerase UlaE